MTDNFVWIILLPFAVVWFGMVFASQRGKSCPDCAQPLLFLQSPFAKTKRMWLEGGHLCAHCGCETDIKGRKVRAGSGTSKRTLFSNLGLLALSLMVALVLLFFILRQSTTQPVAPAQIVRAVPHSVPD